MTAIVVRDLTKMYGSTVGIRGLDLTVEPGEVMGFLGPNGAGKSTTLRCLVGLLRPTSGAARVLDLDPITDHARLAPRIGYLPGELRLYPELTGARTLDLLGSLQGAPTSRRGELCERLDLDATALARPVAGYSRGMKQKVGLVAAFQHDPDVLVLDEPTEGLDPLVQETFFEMLDETSARGATVLLSSHVLSEVERACRRVAIVRSGALVACEEVEVLRTASSRRITVTLADGEVVHETVEKADVATALRRLLRRKVVDVVVEEAGLDEVMLGFYREDDDQGGAR